MPNLALEGIRVVDLSRVLAGPYCTMMLGDLAPRSSRSRCPAAATTPAAGAHRGDHTAQVLGELLGCDEAEVRRLRDEGVI